ncbi:hypothetical protein THAOC_36393 [Thalassiosira oceanica]|uniref:ATP-dependent RNA helicase n=1 Tax=Thalassiosira oceanica TaxID=159749 RepID=K0QZF6_THAOC|nr:hypothetical protein THAOC_36393 [Thalassiosira oceanica]|eukprot:EJK45023.1 hypothetical protein THAOC_36393 [Thalassiosira oceanica]
MYHSAAWRLISLTLPAACIVTSTNAFRHARLFPSVTATWPRFSTALLGVTREAELLKLVDKLDVSQEKVLELLAGQRSKLDGSEPKAKHIDWLLGDHRGLQNEPKPRVRPQQAVQTPAKRNPPPKRRGGDQSLLSQVSFDSHSDIDPLTKRALTDVLGISSMTEIQSKTFAAAFAGDDVLGRARTGTGKTIAFLLPAIERAIREGESNGSISILVVYGGTKVSRDVTRLKKRLPTVLVATPGRLQDLLQTATVGKVRFSTIMARTSVLVLDETDQLLDMGFRREILKIMDHLPSSNDRQTLLFSATIPDELKQVMKKAMRDDYVEVDCIQDGDDGGSSTQTHIHVKQSHAVIPDVSQYVSSVVRVVKAAVQDEKADNKVVVFFPTARTVSYFADIFNEVINLPVLELHSKKSQGYRKRVSDEFRNADGGVLFTSDVSARGVDYPGVTHVVQFGMPSSREQYVHRLGRTGRAGAEGKGWLILGPFEQLFVDELRGIDITKDESLTAIMNKSVLDETDDQMQEMLERVQNGDKKLVKAGEASYSAFLGYYLAQMKRMRMRRKEDLVSIANELSGAMGFRSAPSLPKNLVGKMGLKGVQGINVSSGTSGGGSGRRPQGQGNEDRRRRKPRRRMH